MKWIDIPPNWLFAALLAAYFVPWRVPFGAVFNGVGTLLGGLGFGLIFAALVWVWREKTTPVPHMEADALITSGVFAVSRNPIYLADVLILTGLVLRWDAVLSLPLILFLIWIIDIRFIRAEETRLEQGFGDAFLSYKARTRCWL